MGRTSIKNKFILSFLLMILVVMVVVAAVNLTARDYYLSMGISTAIAMALGVVFGTLFSRSLTRRLTRLSNAARQISDGDLTRGIEVRSRDEVRDLEEIFGRMVDHLRVTIREIRGISLQIQEANGELYQMTRRMLAGSRKINDATGVIAQASEKQTLIAQKTALRVESGAKAMDASLRQSAETVGKISKAMEKIRQGERDARDTLGHLEQVLGQMSAYSQPIFRLAGKVEKIKLIVSVMDAIAQKTDLLSLNASIEATRAGESGKGFAIVADEIRTMADSSKQSSQEITDIVEDILTDNQAVNKFLTQNQKDINRGQEITHGIVRIFGEMLTAVREIFDQVARIQEETGRQVDQMKGLAVNFQELSRLADENFLSTQKTALVTETQKSTVNRLVVSMKSIHGLSEKMVRSQQGFRLPAASGGTPALEPVVETGKKAADPAAVGNPPAEKPAAGGGR